MTSFHLLVNRDGCHMWGRKYSLFPEQFISLPLDSSWFHPFIICLRINDSGLVAWISLTALSQTYFIHTEQNLAIHKPAWQSGTSDSLAASRAVDGRYGGEDGDQRYCADPYNRPKADGRTAPAEWWVDLQDNYTVDHVTLYNTYQSYCK